MLCRITESETSSEPDMFNPKLIPNFRRTLFQNFEGIDINS